MQDQPPGAGQGASDIWRTFTAQNHLSLHDAKDELAFAMLSWAARHPEDGQPAATEYEPLRMRSVDFLALVGCAHIGTDALAAVQAELFRRGVRYYFTNEAGEPMRGAWVRVWLMDYLALGLPGVAVQLRRSRAWFRSRAFDIDRRRRAAEAALLHYASEPTDRARELALLADLRSVKHEQARFEDALAQMTAPQVEPDI